MFKKLNQNLRKNRRARTVLIFSGLALLAVIFIWAIYGNFGILLADDETIPIDIHSLAQANYSQDPEFMKIAPVQLQLVIDAILDHNPGSENLESRLTQVNQNYYAGVVSITPLPPTETAYQTTESPHLTDPALTSSATVISTPTDTVVPSTATDIPPTNSPIPGLPTNTPQPATNTSTPTNTSLPPTNTSAPPTNTDTPPTDTDVPPTETDVPPTDTDVPPTNTPIPPTATTSPCSDLVIIYGGRTGNRMRWELRNNGNSDFQISSIQFSWPVLNDDLNRISLDGNDIWTGDISPPSTTITSGWSGGSSRRTVSAYQDLWLRFYFDEFARSSPYSITVEFTNGCSRSASH